MGTKLGGVLESDNLEQLLREARSHELGCRTTAAMEGYAAVLDLTAQGEAARIRAEALRRLGVLHHIRAESEIANDLCRRSYALALEIGAADLGADACNALAGFALERGDLAEAENRFGEALKLAGENQLLVGKIKQNLGIIANIRGEWQEALEHYRCSLQAYEACADERGCAIAHHNLGMIHADRKQWAEASRHYELARVLAQAAGDRHLTGIAAMNQAEVRLAEGDHDSARAGAEEALEIFSAVDARRHKAGAHRLLGMVARHRDQSALAESHLRAALEIASRASSPLIQADSAKDLASLYAADGRRREALELLLLSRALYTELQAQADLAEVQDRIETLQDLL